MNAIFSLYPDIMSLMETSEKNYEYVVDGHVEPHRYLHSYKIDDTLHIFTKDFTRNKEHIKTFIQNIKKAYWTEDSDIYLHFTCSNLLKSIETYGLYAEANPIKPKITNRGGLRRSHRKLKKSKKNKTKTSKRSKKSYKYKYRI